jgi:hypothetical protein
MKKNKNMKKLLAIALTFVLGFSTVQFLATESVLLDEAKIISSTTVGCPETGFTITETVDEYQRITRTFDRSENIRVHRMSSDSDIQIETEAILSLLGVEQYFIDNMPSDDLDQLSRSSLIGITVSYSITDVHGNVDFVSSEVANLEAQVIQQAMYEADVATRELAQFGITTFETGVIVQYDGILRIGHMWAYVGNGRFQFQTHGRWLTSPPWRGTDSIGYVASTMNPTDIGRSGSISFQQTINCGIRGIVVASNPISRSLNSFRLGNIFAYRGQVAIFDLPQDEVLSNFPGQPTGLFFVRHTDIRVSTIFYGTSDHTPSTPSHVVSFNSSGSYYHSNRPVNHINVSVSVSVGLSGPSLSIGLSRGSNQEVTRHGTNPITIRYSYWWRWN